jgi:hypothetical protein
MCISVYALTKDEMIRWNIVVSEETDTALRLLLAESGASKKGEISKFVEDAVKRRIFDLTVEKIQNRNAKYSAEEITEAVDEAVAAVRRENREARS